MPINQGNFPILNPNQLPGSAVMQGYNSGIESQFLRPLLQQKFAQQQAKTAYAPNQQQADIFSKIAPGIANWMQHVWMYGKPPSNFESMVNQLESPQGGPAGAQMAQGIVNQTNQSQIPTGQLPSGSSPNIPMFSGMNQSPQNQQQLQNLARQHAMAQAAGINSPQNFQQNAHTANMFQTLGNIAKTLDPSASSTIDSITNAISNPFKTQAVASTTGSAITGGNNGNSPATSFKPTLQGGSVKGSDGKTYTYSAKGTYMGKPVYWYNGKWNG